MEQPSITREDREPTSADLDALKAKQQATWSSGNYSVIGVTLQIVGETLCEAVNLRSGEQVLDIAAGNGNASLAAARRFARVISTDYVPALLEHGRVRAQAEGLDIDFQEADAEALGFPDASFDVALSTFGTMFTADHAQTAREMLRVVRPGGRIGMANWTPDGFIGALFKTIGKHVPPPLGAQSPARWGTREWLEAEFGAGSMDLVTTPRFYIFNYRSPEHWLDVFRTWYGPMIKAFGALDETRALALETDIHQLIHRFNRSSDGTLVIPSEYLEVVISKA